MPTALPLLGASPSVPRVGPPLAAKGFRVFFLVAALYAVATLPLWLLALVGRFDPSGYLDPVSWHAHEMLFGYAVAVIAGFLLTAVGNWTSRETLVGTPLLGLAALWLLGRATLTWASALPRWLPALTDLAFLPTLIVVLARPLIAARSKRNYGVVAILTALFAANLAMHLDALGALPGWRRQSALLALDLVALVVLLIAGRVFPMFTRNATRVESIRSSPGLDKATLGAMAALSLLDAAAPSSKLAAVVAGVTGALAAARAAHWGARHTASNPLLWVLHVGYAWIPLALLLRALSAFTSMIPSTMATHALTVGAIGTLTLGMMVRVSLGHSGRPLVASRKAAWSFTLITLSALVRVGAPLLAPGAYRPSLMLAGTLWTVAFALYLVDLAPALMAPRPDGKAG